MNIDINDFVRRQVKGSGKTYAKPLSFGLIAEHAESQMGKNYFSDGYRDGVRVVHVDQSIVEDFVCPYVKLDESIKIISKLVCRRPGEEPYIQTRAINGTLLIAHKVNLIIYRHDILKENKENTTNANWELISINSIPFGVKDLPMGPVTMMRNQLNLAGGTKAKYTSEEWSRSVRFWQQYAPLASENDTI